MGADEILRRYVLDFGRNSILAEAHGGVVGGHYVGKATTEKFFHAGLWWPMLHKGLHIVGHAMHVNELVDHR